MAKQTHNKKQITQNEEPIKPEQIKVIPINEEIKSSYLDYAMSVIVARALPDVRDGFKPVHRRILYAMSEMGLNHSAKYRKSATVVGNVLGRFHPHGDLAVYDSMVRLAQDFSLRYPLIDGQGNWGSIDGDSAAAYRYTECRLTPIAEEMLSDIEKETVNFIPNYDGTTKEPQVLPAKIPNLLLNGSMGIAVGMATNIPPHNLSELCDAISYLIDHPHTEIDNLFQFIKGPDFPTGGLIFDQGQIKQAYALGRGPIVARGTTEIVEKTHGSFQILITEIPYLVNKSDLLQKIAGLVKEKKIEGIRDIRDESGKEGIRVVIDLKKDTFPQKILNRLFELTALQQSFHVNMVVLIDGIQPKLVGLRTLLEEYVKHRQVVVRRRTEYDLVKTRERIHILKGLGIAVDHIEEIIKLIKKSEDREDAKNNLMKKYHLSEIQAQAILEMKLHQIAHLERNKIKDELKEKLQKTKELEEILAKPKMILKIIKDELAGLKEKFGDERRTKLVSKGISKFKEEDLIPNESAIIMITRDGYIKRVKPEVFKTQARGGKGVTGLDIKEEDEVQKLITTATHANLLFFTTKGKVFQLKTYEIPEISRTARGQALVNFLEIEANEKVSAILPVSDLKGYEYFVMVTKNGIIKKVKIDVFETVRRSGLIALKLKGDDTLEWVKSTKGADELVLVTCNGQAIRFNEKKLRPMGRGASGVKAMRLKKDDLIIGMNIIKSKTDDKLLIVTENGFGKMTAIKNYRLQNRGGTGLKTAKITAKNGKIINTAIINEKDLPQFIKGDLLIISQLGQVIRLPLKDLPIMGRSTQGVRLMRFKEEKDKVASVTLI